MRTNNWESPKCVHAYCILHTRNHRCLLFRLSARCAYSRLLQIYIVVLPILFFRYSLEFTRCCQWKLIEHPKWEGVLYAQPHLILLLALLVRTSKEWELCYVSAFRWKIQTKLAWLNQIPFTATVWQYITQCILLWCLCFFIICVNDVLVHSV